MERNRRKKLIIIFVLFACIASLSIGFAAFSATLNISSSASVSPNSDTFSVKFSTNQNSLDDSDVSPSSMSDSITATNGVINNSFNPMISNLTVSFTSPGQYVEYTFYARNEGEYTAYLNSVNFIGNKTCEKTGDASVDLVNSACDDINISVSVAGNEYFDTTEIAGHALSKDSGEEIKVRLEYEEDGTAVDGDFKVIFNDIMLVYSTIDDSSYMPPSVMENNFTNGTLNYEIKRLAISTDKNIDFYDEDNYESGVFIYAGTENDTNPIYYYRGVVDNNNVLFANFCWKIVRTTDTGGSKLLYNGIPSADGKCLSESPDIGRSVFNETSSSDADMRYVYEDGTSSTIKSFIDSWYEANLIGYTDKLEDTVWCNDRTISSESNGNINYRVDGLSNFEDNPTLYCPSEYSLNVSTNIIGNKLNYPIAMLTGDEIILGGWFPSYAGRFGYLCEATADTECISPEWFSLSPLWFRTSQEICFFGLDSADFDYSVWNESLVRPAISLKSGTLISGGDGSSDTPYIIK